MTGPTYSVEDVKRLTIYAKKCTKVSPQGCEKVIKAPEVEQLLLHVSTQAPARTLKIIEKMQAACIVGLENAKNSEKSKKRALDGEVGDGQGGGKRQCNDDEEETVINDAYERYETETAITDGEPPEYIKDHCLDTIAKIHLRDRGDFDIQAELNAVLEDLQKLEFEVVKDRIVGYMKDCLAVHEKEGPVPTTTDTSVQWSSSSPMHILEVLLKKHKDAETAKINKGYGQPIFYHAINKQAEDSSDQYQLSADQLRNKRLIELEELAYRKAGPVSRKKKEAIYSSFRAEYDAGKVWLDAAGWFGGDAIVIVLVLAGVGSSKVTDGWTKYQRDCFRYISMYLYGIRKLVVALDGEALEWYCRHGFLEKSVIERVEATEIYVPS